MQLLERDDALDGLADALAASRAGTGQVVLLCAEAGGGKTSVLERFLAGVPGDVRVRRGWCDALATPRPLGPLLDMGLAPGAGEPRLELFARVTDLLQPDAPLVVAVEDLHWADEATVDVLRYLARRIAGSRMLLVLTCRDDEVRDGPVRLLLGDLATAARVRRIALSPLSRAGVAALVGDTRGDVDAVLALTGGNPFYVAEVARGDGGLPPVVRDAVLSRAARLAPGSREALEAAAVLGLRADPVAVAAVGRCEPATLDAAVEAGLLTASLGQVAFRHEIARQAIEEAIAPSRRRELNARALALLEDAPRPAAVARLVRHAVEAGDRAAIARLAARAGDEAAAAGAHREAAAQYARALETGVVDAATEASLWRRRSYRCYLTGQTADALAAMEAAVAIARRLDDDVAVGSGLRWISRLQWFLARRAAAARAVDEAIAILERCDDRVELAWAYSTRSQLAMLGQDMANAVADGERALALAGPDGSPDLVAHALNNIGTARLIAGDRDGAALLERALALGRAHGAEEHVARVYCNLSSAAVARHDCVVAGRWLREALDYAAERDLDAWGVYLSGWDARRVLDEGDAEGASAAALVVLDHPRAAPVASVTPLVVLALARARRGEDGALGLLDQALAIARGADEIQRLGPVAAAFAELAWLAGDAAPPLLGEVVEIAAGTDDVWALLELATWSHRLGRPLAGARIDAARLATSMPADPLGAAAHWRAAGAPAEEALALIDAGLPSTLHEAVGILDRLGARGPATVARRRLRDLGAAVPSGPRASTRANPFGLTARELEVLVLLRGGASDAEIADRLTISVRTAGHHVSAILRKLDVPTRGRAAARADELLAT